MVQVRGNQSLKLREWLTLAAVLLAFGIVGEMDRRDALAGRSPYAPAEDFADSPLLVCETPPAR